LRRCRVTINLARSRRCLFIFDDRLGGRLLHCRGPDGNAQNTKHDSRTHYELRGDFRVEVKKKNTIGHTRKPHPPCCWSEGAMDEAVGSESTIISNNNIQYRTT